MTSEVPTQEKTGTSGGSTHKSRASVIVLYLVALAIVFASAVVLTIVLNTTAFLWPLTLLGAFVIAALVTAAAMPYLQRSH